MRVVGVSPYEHKPVLLEPVLEHLNPQPGHVILDGTIGLGGHAVALLPRILPDGRYIGLDVDEQMVEIARQRLVEIAPQNVDLFKASYVDFPEALGRLNVSKVDHMFLDLGVNSAQLDDPQRGFSFDQEGPLDMRFDQSAGTPAIDLVNALSEKELADLFYFNAQETGSRKIAKRICQVRHTGRITTTRALSEAVCSAFGGPRGLRPGKIHPATRVFQALRIAVNQELDNLRAFLERVITHLRVGGRLAVISFHSLEDGLAKQYLREAKKAGTMRELTRRPIIAEPAEREANPRSRSAKLRVAERTETS